MAAVRFVDVQARPTEFLDLTSLTPDEFEQLIPPFEDDFQDHMARWRLDGKPRTARRFAVYKNCPLPTPHDRLFFLLTYLKTYSLQVMAGAGLTLVQGRLFGMSQGKANHIPSDLVATPRSSHNRLDFSMPYPHDVSFSPAATHEDVLYVNPLLDALEIFSNYLPETPASTEWRMGPRREGYPTTCV